MHTSTVLLTLAALVATASAGWKMDVSYDDNTKLSFDGHVNSGCTKFKKTGAGIDNVYFKKSTFADTFELFNDDKCKDLGFQGHDGSNPVPDAVYGSYKVY
jgi:hypothetical protein